MISRRIIRTKVLHMLYAFYTSSDKTLDNIEKELFFCIRKSYDLYHYLMILALEIADYAEQRIEIRRNKHQPTYDDLHPNTKFITNQIIQQLRENRQLNAYIQQQKLSWVNHPELIKGLYHLLTESDFYKAYMADKNQSYTDDRKCIEKVFNQVILLKHIFGDIVQLNFTLIIVMQFIVSLSQGCPCGEIVKPFVAHLAVKLIKFIACV